MANHTRQMTVDPVLQRIIDSLIKQNKTQKSLIDYLEMHPNTFNNWKYANSKSYYKHINEIAEFLNLTPGYLLKGNTISADIAGLSPTEKRIIDKIRTLTDEQQKSIADTLDLIL